MNGYPSSLIVVVTQTRSFLPSQSRLYLTIDRDCRLLQRACLTRPHKRSQHLKLYEVLFTPLLIVIS